MSILTRSSVEFIDIKTKLLGSLLHFTQVFYKIRTGRHFLLSTPLGRESHYITVMRELTKVSRLETKRLLINIPPGHGKSTMLVYFVAWTMAQFPDSQFLYISYGKTLAEKHTAEIKAIMELRQYKEMFEVTIADDSSAKGNFKTNWGGRVVAFGAAGAITGQDAGLPNLDRFSGTVIIDDAHKPDEVHSDTMRESVIQNYNETIKPRPRSPNVPIIFLGQRLHEDDLAAFLIDGKDGYDWRKVILAAKDAAGNMLCPNLFTLEMAEIEERTNPYVYSAQHQQEPMPAGGGLFKKDWFVLTKIDPDIFATFITVDTAETEKSFNDATVFSFWGIYKIKHGVVTTDINALHMIDCLEIRIEPKDLQDELLNFFYQCMMHKIKPKIIAIEKKSTGVTLSSTLKALQGIRIVDIQRTKASGPKVSSAHKISRYIEMQKYIASGYVSLPIAGQHTEMVVTHMSKILANGRHRHDDICDTVYDAVRLALIDQSFFLTTKDRQKESDIAKSIMSKQTAINRAIGARYGQR